MPNVSKPTALTSRQRLIMSLLVRLRFATVQQLMFWVGAEHESSVSRPCGQLLRSGFIEQHADLSPRAYRLSRKGSQMLSTNYRRSWLSFAALQQSILKNDVEIHLRKMYPKTIHIEKTKLLTIGLNPAVGEYGFKHGKQLFFVLIDDYLMASKRILHCWDRQHTPSHAHYDIKQGGFVNWRSYADQFFLFCCDEDQLKQHQEFAEKHKIPLQSAYLPATWGIAV